MTAGATNGIEVAGLVREFKGGLRAVDGIDLEVAPGEIYGFLDAAERYLRAAIDAAEVG